jgi:hypothetical protein
VPVFGDVPESLPGFAATIKYAGVKFVHDDSEAKIPHGKHREKEG